MVGWLQQATGQAPPNSFNWPTSLTVGLREVALLPTEQVAPEVICTEPAALDNSDGLPAFQSSPALLEKKNEYTVWNKDIHCKQR